MSKKYDKCLETRPETVAIVAMGPTSSEYIKSMSHHEKWKSYPDEVWTINFAANWCRSDKMFLMDGFARDKDWHLWAKKHIKTPMICPYPIKGYPNVVRYPLEQVINATQDLWYGNTVAYAIAYACATGVKELRMYGCDFAYEYKELAGRTDPNASMTIDPKDMQHIQGIELGHAAVTYWMGVAQRFGIQIALPPTTTLASYNNREFYGYGDKQPLVRITGVNNESNKTEP